MNICVFQTNCNFYFRVSERKFHAQKRVKRLARECEYLRYFFAREEKRRGKRHERFSIQYWHVTVSRWAHRRPRRSFLQPLSTGCRGTSYVESNPATASNCDYCSKKDRAARLWVDFLFASANRSIFATIGPRLFASPLFFFEVPAFFLPHIHRV